MRRPGRPENDEKRSADRVVPSRHGKTPSQRWPNVVRRWARVEAASCVLFAFLRPSFQAIKDDTEFLTSDWSEAHKSADYGPRLANATRHPALFLLI